MVHAIEIIYNDLAPTANSLWVRIDDSKGKLFWGAIN